MRLPSIPGPSDVLSAVGGVRKGIQAALALVPRIATVVGRVERLLDRVDTLVDRVEGVVGRADEAIEQVGASQQRADQAIERVGTTQQKADQAIERVGASQQRADQAIERVGDTQQKADQAIERVGDTQQKADQAITAVDRTTARADALLGRTEELVDEVTPLAEDYAAPLRLLAPSVQRLAETLEPHEVEALVTLVDRLPQLASTLDENVLPVLATMGNVSEDVHDLLDTMQDLRQVVKGFPGSRLFRRRGAEEIAEEDEDEDEEAAEA